MAAIYKNFITNEGSELERIYHMPFKDCALYISKMDTLKKADVAGHIQPILESLYEQANRYGNEDYPAEDRIGPDVFVLVMGKIKRWETVLYWLYEIDILMGETQLDALVRDAEARMEKVHWNKEATRVRMIKGDDGKKHRKIVNAYDEFMDLKTQQYERGIHTEEIMDMASSLAAKYFVR